MYGVKLILLNSFISISLQLLFNRYDYTETFCSNCKSDLRNTNTIGQEETREEEEKIVMNYLLRLMTASSAMGNTLKRKEYRT